MLALIDNYDSFTYNVAQYLAQLGHEPTVYRNDQISVERLFSLPLSALIVSPGPCDPTKAGISCAAIERAAEAKLPMFGICLGFQCVGHVFGGTIARAPYLMHGKVSEVFHDGTGIFQDMPSPLKATRYHSLALLPETTPDCLRVTAKTQDGVIMGAAHRSLPIHGVQFHPESILTEHGHRMLANFLRLAGLDVPESAIPSAPK